MNRITKAIFPAAGLGTRFLPATKASPKEMLPLVDKPLIQYVVEEAVASGIEEIVLVTGRGKRAIEDHFDVAFELEEDLKAKGKHKLLSEVQRIANLVTFCYITAEEGAGPGPRGADGQTGDRGRSPLPCCSATISSIPRSRC